MARKVRFGRNAKPFSLRAARMAEDGVRGRWRKSERTANDRGRGKIGPTLGGKLELSGTTGLVVLECESGLGLILLAMMMIKRRRMKMKKRRRRRMKKSK